MSDIDQIKESTLNKAELTDLFKSGHHQSFRWWLHLTRKTFRSLSTVKKGLNRLNISGSDTQPSQRPASATISGPPMMHLRVLPASCSASEDHLQAFKKNNNNNSSSKNKHRKKGAFFSGDAEGCVERDGQDGGDRDGHADQQRPTRVLVLAVGGRSHLSDVVHQQRLRGGLVLWRGVVLRRVV